MKTLTIPGYRIFNFFSLNCEVRLSGFVVNYGICFKYLVPSVILPAIEFLES
jgi:hypothetical protein